jgi:tetratricopeptide (TPR) repeat protein
VDLVSTVDDATPATRPAGTPAYMSPEQLAGELLDGRSDQYSFCIALKKSLRQLRPRGGGLEGGQKRRFDEIMDKGLAERPQQRYESMLELLEALDTLRRPPRSARRAAFLTLGLLGLGGLSFGAYAQRSDPLEACRAGSSRLSERWETSLPALRTTLADERRGAETLKVVQGPLSSYAAQWGAQRGEACEATWGRGEQSDASLELRLACLDRRATQFESLLDAMKQAQGERLDALPRAVSTLPDIEACTRVDALARTTWSSETPPETVALLETLDAKLAAARVRLELGVLDGLAPHLEGLVAEARGLGHASTLALALRLYAQSLEESGKGAGDELLQESFVTAQRAGDDEVSLDAALDLSAFEYSSASDFKQARFWADTAQAIADRTRAVPVTYARIYAARGYTSMFAMEYEQAAKELEQATSVIAEVDEAQVLRWRFSINRAQVLDLSGQSEQALEVINETVAALPQHYGPHHPFVLKARSTQSTVLLGMARLDEARTAYHELLAVYDATGVPMERQRIVVYLNLGELERQAGNYEDAIAHLEEALRLLDATEGPGRHYVTAYFNLSAVYEMQGEYQAGLEAAQSAIGHLPEDVRTSDPQNLAWIQVNAAVMLLRLDRKQEARAMLEESKSMLVASLGESHVGLVQPYLVSAKLFVMGGEWKAALAEVERGLAILGEPSESHAYERGQFRGSEGEARLELGELDAAEAALRESIDLLPRDPFDQAWSKLHLARVEVARGEASAAQTMREACEALSGATTADDQARHERCKAELAKLGG